ncbi:hypothetical protein [Acidovorax sp. CCYZU-2555]|uniref:hypothetical protein n=1 Tax=Acidovorax sp. CCYZU-2555 TaxID=2835042 RepID=UPI001BCB60C3|nr:hypothetical protein [Acidovorax sp. CCYZU-2555]MBS7778509.1 hypothetical protein [Acidovorax sp. CCYZU-2555]
MLLRNALLLALLRITAPDRECFFDLAQQWLWAQVLVRALPVVCFRRQITEAGRFLLVRLFIQHLFKEPGKPFDAVPPTEQLLRNAFVAAMD